MSERDEQAIDADNAAVDGAVADVQQVEDRAEPVTVEDIAMKLGWSPKDKWRGADDGWRDAATFLEHTASEQKSLRRTVKEMRDTVSRMSSAQTAAMDRALDAQKRQLEAKWEQAVEDGDKQAAKAAERELKQIERQQDSEEPVVASFVDRNKGWFQKDSEATAYAIAQSQRLASDGLDKAAQLEEVERLTKKRFPELFDDEPAPKKAAPSVLSTNSRAASARPRERGFADLPADAKAAWAKFDHDFKRRGFADGYPKDDYAKEFWGNQAA